MAQSKSLNNVSKLRDIADVTEPRFGAVAGGDLYAAIVAAIAADVAVLHIPAGSWTLSAGITLNRAIRIEGDGSCNDNGTAGVATTKISYSGAGIAITLDGTGANGKENIHLSDFSLFGTSAATGGILVGVTTNVSKCSMRNVHVTGFTKVNAYGVCFQKCYLSLFENLYAQENYNGFLIGVAACSNTTLTFNNCISRSNYHLGWSIRQITNGLFNLCAAESNDNNGLAIQALGGGDVVDSLTFINWHSESNLGDAHSYGNLGNATIYITGGATRIRMIGGYVSDLAGAVKALDLDNVNNSKFGGFSYAGASESSGFMTVSVNTSNCVYEATDPAIPETYITGYAPARISLLVNGASSTYTPTLTNTTNVSASTARLCNVMRVGNMVTVSGLCDVTPTAAGPTATNLGMSIPYASSFTTGFEAGGAGSTDTTVSDSIGISADTANDAVDLTWRATSTAAQTCYFQFSYRIV